MIIIHIIICSSISYIFLVCCLLLHFFLFFFGFHHWFAFVLLSIQFHFNPYLNFSIFNNMILFIFFLSLPAARRNTWLLALIFVNTFCIFHFSHHNSSADVYTIKVITYFFFFHYFYFLRNWKKICRECCVL